MLCLKCTSQAALLPNTWAWATDWRAPPLLPVLCVGQHPRLPLVLQDGVLVVFSWAVPGKKAGMQLLVLWLHLQDLRMDFWPVAAWSLLRVLEYEAMHSCRFSASAQGPLLVVSSCCPPYLGRCPPLVSLGSQEPVVKLASDYSHPLQVCTFALKVSHLENKRQPWLSPELGN